MRHFRHCLISAHLIYDRIICMKYDRKNMKILYILWYIVIFVKSYSKQESAGNFCYKH